MKMNESIYNYNSYYDHNGTQYICMGVKPYYYEKYYQCNNFDCYYKCPCDPCSRCCHNVVPTGPLPPVPPVPTGPLPPIIPPILGSAAFQSAENLGDNDPYDLNPIFNDGIVNEDPGNITVITLLANRIYSYNFEIEVDVPQGGAFNVGGELTLDGVVLPGSTVITSVEQRPGVAIVSGAGIIAADPNERELEFLFKSDIGNLDSSMRLNIDWIG